MNEIIELEERPEGHLLLVRLAREIAIDHYPLNDILTRYSISPEEFEQIRENHQFITLLMAEQAAWNSATNTEERTKLKAAAVIEEWLPEANALIHDKQQLLSGKAEIAKLLTSIAGMGVRNARVEGAGGERFSVTINLGADAKLSFDKTKVIESTVND